ncbi:16S rRNA (uracil(1498)-N(3))-methyltransferase [Leptospira ilyithenensis]|uniref:Ribosomal RNA small subunit methyltransferase E n=1 Tax=Leptospira ilyithenensis TaxID=2484901 RepID=A0A4R9LQF2_9LEPT|nr:RsmE family RNA methyltransferase [Leptospira ilyithenensis]TGN10070.1 16S rRNA (uracil(1498)-N(3))-methyltransferase [Leptospira ilyithenensis]
MKENSFLVFREGFVPKEKIPILPEEIAHLRSLRLDKIPCEIEIRDGLGKSYFYSYEPGNKSISFLSETILNFNLQALSLVIALPKGNRLDFFLQKATELGIQKIYFCIFRHSIRKEFNLDRAKKIVREAASQSKQAILPILEIVDAKNWMEENKNRICILHPGTERIYKPGDFSRLIPVIGPEGGFHSEEEEWMTREKIPKFSFPGGILRTETAGIAAASLIAFAERKV